MQNPKLSAAIRKAALTDGVIDRIVRGRLVYAVPRSGKSTFAFKMTQVILDTPRGPQPYQGEDLAELGVGLSHPVRWGVLGEAAPAAPGLSPNDLRLVIQTTD